ncbi:hypothetical protein D4T97_018285 [Siminovitchia acidinfaciens]|uniref:DUF4097 domain-containing protein n=1 Tax=Siminovitchia acidinfaciens TaxID=2321395 RepID=A0A429XUQ1_9BACI|nr:DUF4097 family beta strand repeat-containing protein [Siminovitchia acidinfaciens]RST71855.1 hypothetical protein D4T97_018285 [Siminovitchia acidinfaciens]
MTLIKKISIVALLLLVIGTVGSLLTVKSAMKSIEVEEERTINDQFTNIQVKTNNSRVEIIPTEASVTTVELTGKVSKNHKLTFETDVKGGTLYVDLKDRHRMLFSMDFFTSIQLKVHVPKEQYGSIQIKSNNGRILAEELDVKDLHADTDNGRIELKNIKGSTVKARSSNGRIELRRIDTDSVDAETDNGSIFLNEVYGNITGSSDNGKITMENDHIDQLMEFETDNGRIEIQTKKEPADVTFHGRTSNGKVTIFDQTYSKEFEVGDGKNLIKLKSQNGSITVTK